MQISELREQVRARMLEFAWDQWAQMGVFGTSRRQDRWAADPEALLLFTFEAGRGDARLFEEVLDWLLLNERLVSVQRLRNLCRDDADRALVEASLAWMARWRPRARLAAKDGRRKSPSRAQPLFRESRISVRRPDDAFRSYGWLKPDTPPSRKSQAPGLLAQINFSFRLRQMLGVGARAEVVRVLLTASGPRLTAQAVTESAGYAKRNVYEALTSLHAAGVIDGFAVGNEWRYGVERERWVKLLGLTVDELPSHRDWPQLFHALRLLVRWLEDDRHETLSEYMLASEARVLAEEIEPELRFAGVQLNGAGRPGAGYWEDFGDVVRAAVDALA